MKEVNSMKKLAVFLGLLAAIVFCGAEKVNFDNSSNKVELLRNSQSGMLLSYSLSYLDMESITLKTGNYTELSIDGYTYTNRIGFPKLPLLRKIISVPLNAVIESRLTSSSTTSISLAEKGLYTRLVPCQASVSKSDDPEKLPFIIDNDFYSGSNRTDEPSVKIVELGMMRGTRLVALDFVPVQYNPATTQLEIITTATVEVVYSDADWSATQALAEKYYSSVFEPLFSKTLLNYEPGRTSLDRFPLGMIIVTPQSYVATLQPFVNWKTQQGYAVTIATTESIGSTTTAIKAYLQNIWNSATTQNPAPSYLIIAGDTPQVPAWIGETNSNHVTDLTYVRLQGTDYLPEMYYGRFSASNTTQLESIISKTLQYETYSMPDPAYLSHTVLIAGTDATYGPVHGNGQINYGKNYYFGESTAPSWNPYGTYQIRNHMYLHPASGTSDAAIIQNMNDGIGYANYTAHGGEGAWGNPTITINNINNMTNTDKYFVAVGNCCLTNAFDTAECFGEAFIRASNKGAVAYVGATNSSYWDEDYYWAVGHKPPVVGTGSPYRDNRIGAYDALFHNHSEAFADWASSVGSMIFMGNLAVAAANLADNYYWEIYSVMGDPSLIPYMGIPTQNYATYPSSITYGSSSMEVTADPYTYVALTFDDQILSVGLTNSSGNLTLNYSPISSFGTYKLVMTRSLRQPVIAYFDLSLFDANNWNGNMNTDWQCTENWSDHSVPGSFTNVVIPGGLSNYPVISAEDARCDNIYVQQNAHVTVSGYTLSVRSDFYASGQLRMNQENSVLDVTGNINWENGSTALITNGVTAIYCKGSMTFSSDSNVQILMGDIQFQDTQNSYIINKSSLTQINNLVSDKTSPAFLAFSSESTQPITVNGNIINLQSRTMFNYYPGNIVLRGNLTSHNTNASGGLMWFHGTLVMDGTNQSISLANASSYVNNLTASQTGTLTYTNALTVKGNLTVDTGSSITIGSTTLTVEDNAAFSGQLIMNSGTGDLYVLGNIVWESGSTAIITNASADIYCQGNMTFASTSNVQMTSGYIEFYGAGESNIENHKSTTQIYNLRSNKTAPGFLAISASSNQSLTINGSIWNYQNRILHNYYSGTVSLKGNLNNYNTNTDGFVWNTGTLNLSGTNQTIALANPADCITNLILAQSGIVTCNNDLRINGTITMRSGTFSPGAHIVYVGLNWTQNSAATFTNTNSTVVFNGALYQIVDNANFNVMRLSKSGGNLQIQSGSTVVAASYKYDMGTIEVSGGTFTVNDLADNNIKGNYILSSGIINLTQDDTYFVDLDANLNISGGVMNVSGGYNFPVDWACTRNINITMSGGILDWGTNSIGITETGFIATLVLTGGTIRTQGSVSISRPNVYFLGGTFEMYGSPDVNLSLNVAAAFYNLNINKASTREDNNRNERVNHVVLTGNVNIDNDLIVTSGILNLGNYTCNVTNNASFYGTLSMTLTGALLHVSKDITWYTGSTGIITAGVINIERNWTNQNGITLQIGIGNNVNFTGTLSSILSLADSTASFGNITINKASNSVYADAGTQYLNVAGNLTVNSNNIFNFRNSTSMINGILAVNGTATLMAGSILDVYEINLANTMSITDATVNISHDFTKLNTSNLTISSGSFNLNAPYTGTLYSFAGRTNLNGGAFQITNEGILLGASSYFNHSGGTLKLGWGFTATAAGAFQPTQGAVEFIGSRTATIECSNGNYFHDVIFNKTGTGYQILFATNVTVNNDMFVQGGNPYLMNHTLTVNRDIVINGGVLSAGNAADIINVGRNWSNNVDPNAFAQGSGIVNFFSGQTATVSTETFYKVIVSKTSADVNDLILSAGKTMTVNGYLDISSGCLKVEPGSILDTNGTVTIESSGGLDLDSSGSPTTLRVAGNMYDEGDESGIGIGLNADTGTTLIFDGSADQTFGADYISQVINLCNVTVNKSGGKVKPYNSINFLGNFTVTNGEWSYATAGKTKNFSGDLIVETGGIFSDSTGTSNIIGSSDTNLKLLGTAKFGTLILNKTISNSLTLSGNATFAGTTIITLTTGTLNLNSKTLKYTGTLTIGADGKLCLTGGSILNINDSSTLSIGIGGEFVSLGANGNPAMVTSDIGYYTFSTRTNSYVGAQYTIFEKMGTNGINIASRCGVDTTNVFRGCTFRNGIAGGTLLTMNSQQFLNIYNAVFPTNTWGGLYNVSRTNVLGSVTFRNFAGAFAGAANHYTTNNSIFWETPAPPSAPATVTIECTLAGAVITWSPVPGVSEYIVYRSFVPDSFGIENILTHTGLTTYTDEYMSVYPKAFYMIKAYAE